MKKWKHSGILILMLSLLAMSTFALTLTLNAEPTKAVGSDYTYGGVISINSNGSITPSNATISRVGNTYTFTGNITAYEIGVYRSNIVLDGNECTLQDATPGTHDGVYVMAENVTVQSIHIQQFSIGVILTSSSPYSTVSGNNITNNGYGVYLTSSSYCAVSGNNITANTMMGVELDSSSNHNTVSGNNITDSEYGVYLVGSPNNRFFHNNLVGNGQQVSSDSSPNAWDDGYPSGGNYWSNYQTRYPSAAEIDSSGIWNTPYVINSNNTDHYPLMQLWSPAHMVSYLVVRGEDDAIYYRPYNSTSTSWGSWNRVPSGATPDSPAAAVYFGTLYVVVRGEDGQSLWFGSVNLTDNGFSGWTLLSGATPSAPTLVSYGTQLCLVVRGLDDSVYYCFYNCTAESWGSWSMIPTGATIDRPTAAVMGQSLYLVVRDMDGSSIWQGSLNVSTSHFSGWTQVSGATPSAPALASYPAGSELHLIVQGEDNAIYHGFWNASSWQGWTLLPGATPDSPAVTVVGSMLQITVRGTDGTSLWFATVNLTTKALLGWTMISGATPSAPILTS